MVGAVRLWRIVLLSLLGTVGTDTSTTCPGYCGQRPLARSFGTRIIGGVDARPGAWPWIVTIQALYYEGQFQYHSCGGSLITPIWVLSAAHCFSRNKDLNSYRLLIGAWKLHIGWIDEAPADPNLQERKPVKIIIHENYDSDFQKNDIALIQLDRPIKCGDMAHVACLPQPGDRLVRPAEKCYVAGWGFKSENANAPSKILQEAPVNIINTVVCNGSHWYMGYVHTHNLCAGYQEGKIDTCKGDSGGPLMCKDKDTGTYVVVGITSWGSGCARAFRPGIYTSTWHFMSWIASRIGSASLLAQRPPKPLTTTSRTTTTRRPYGPWYKPYPVIYRPWWVMTTPFRQWLYNQKEGEGTSPDIWPHSNQPWPLGSPLTHPPPMDTAISNPVLVKAQVLGPSQVLPLPLSLPKRMRQFMDSMKSNKTS